jgi:hypothetical protein
MMRSAVFALLLASCAVLLLRSSPLALAASPPSCSPQVFAVSPSPNPSTGVSYLNGIAAAASNDIWAVGFTYDASSNTQPTLIEHYTGSAWSVVASPSPGGYSNYLTGISLLSSTNIWAAGYQQSTSFAPVTSLMEQWNGSSWNVIPSANASGTGTYTYLQGVSALSATDIWAVGYSQPASADSTATFTEHWDGSSWSVVPSPNLGSQYNSLSGVAGVSSTDVWAVGSSGDPAGNDIPIAEHWNGTAWSIVPTPSVVSGDLLAVTALSSTDVWAVGNFVSSASPSLLTFIEHWDGAAWSVVPSPNYPGVSENSLNGIAADSASDIWAVGHYVATNNTTKITAATVLTLALHWNGTTWSIVPSASPGGSAPQDELAGVVALSPTQAWAVGRATGQNGGQTLIEHTVRNPTRLMCPR